MNDKQNIENQDINFDSQANNASQGSGLSGATGEQSNKLSLNNSIDIDKILTTVPPISAAHLKDGILKNIGLNDAAIKAQAIKIKLFKYSAVALVMLFISFFSMNYWNNETPEDAGKQIQTKIYSQTQETKNNALSALETQKSKISNQTAKVAKALVASQKGTQQRITSMLATNNDNDNADYNNRKNNSNDVILSSNPANKQQGQQARQEYDFASALNTLNYNTIQAANISRESTPQYQPMQPVYARSLYSFLNNFDMQVNWYGLNYNYPNSTSIVSNSLISDFSIALLYNISENNAVGLMAGNDFFMLQYEGWEGKEKFEYNQHFQTLWFGATYKHEFSSRWTIANQYDVIPYTQIGVSYANIGIYSQLNAGLKIKLDDKSALTLGITSGALLYQYDAWWASSKAGLNVGFMFGL